MRLANCADLNRLGEIQAGHRAYGGRGQIQQTDEEQRPSGRVACVADLRHREKSHDHMRKACGADHERGRDAEDVDRALRAARVGREAQCRHDLVEFVEKENRVALHGAGKRNLRDRGAGDLQRDENGRHGEGEDQDAVLGDLRIRYALHAAEHGVDKNDSHAANEPEADRHLEKSRENDADAAHLPGDVGKGDEHEADDRDDACGPRVVTFSDELRDRKFAELAQVRRE